MVVKRHQRSDIEHQLRVDRNFNLIRRGDRKVRRRVEAHEHIGFRWEIIRVIDFDLELDCLLDYSSVSKNHVRREVDFVETYEHLLLSFDANDQGTRVSVGVNADKRLINWSTVVSHRCFVKDVFFGALLVENPRVHPFLNLVASKRVPPSEGSRLFRA